MIIEESDFRLTQVDDHSNAWDMELLTRIQPRGKEERWEFKIIAYSLNLKEAMRSVIRYKINKKYIDNQTISLDEYLNEYKLAAEEVKKIYSKYFKDTF